MLGSATGADFSGAEIEAIHSRKTELAGEALLAARPSPRPGVASLIAHCKSHRIKVGFVTTTYRANIDAIFAAVDGLSRDDFDYVGSRNDVEQGKPAPDAFLAALKMLGVAPGDALAIEDTAISVMSAKRAGLSVVATPGELSVGQDLWQADLVLNDIADASFYAIADDFSRRGGRGKCRFGCHFQLAARAGNRAGCRRIVNTFAFATH